MTVRRSDRLWVVSVTTPTSFMRLRSPAGRVTRELTIIGRVGVGAGVGVGVGVGVGSELEDDEELVVGEGLGVGERQRKVSNEQEMSHDKVPPA